MTQQIDLTIKY